MTKPLVVVESPTKVRTIKKYLGEDFNVAATVGHIKDLPSKEMGIDIENGFTPQYHTIPGKQKVISALKKAAGDATEVFLAPDPDREGEAIAWHTAEILKKKGRQFHRVLFHELTRNAIRAAMAAPEPLHRKKYEAQQARRILDRLVGYQISPLLWRKVKSGLSAGRVQSVAVRIICEREKAIQAFLPEEYWSITAHLEGDNPPPFSAKLVKKNGKKLTIPDQTAADGILAELAGAPLTVANVHKRTTQRNPLPPFITSKLQQEAIRRLRFSAKKTMVVAQQLYEGIDLGPGEPVGLITYMRTDSTRIAQEAAEAALQLIAQRFGEPYAIGKPRFFKNKNKAQDAHEAIRPTSVLRTPEEVAAHLSQDQLALYRLIWQRFVASQMPAAQINQQHRHHRCRALHLYRHRFIGQVPRFHGALHVGGRGVGKRKAKRQSPRTQRRNGPETQKVLNPSSTSPSRRRAFPRPRWSRSSRKTGSVAPAPMPRFCPPSARKAMWIAGKGVFQAQRIGVYRQRSAGAEFSGRDRRGFHGQDGGQPRPH